MIKDSVLRRCLSQLMKIVLKNLNAAFTPHFVFSLTGAAKKHIIGEKPLIKRFFKGTGVVLAGIECSPKIFDFRANGIPVQERVDFFDTLRQRFTALSLIYEIPLDRTASKRYNYVAKRVV